MAITNGPGNFDLFCCWWIFSSGAAIISHYPMCGGGNRVAQATIVTIVEQTGQGATPAPKCWTLITSKQ